MSKFYLRCLNCLKKFSQESLVSVCDDCGGQLQIHLDYNTLKEKIKNRDDFLKLSPRFPSSLWKYFDFLPLIDEKNIVSLGEGLTPLLKCKNLGSEVGVKDIFIKNETMNPTGSFKDRQVTMGISKAIEMKKKGILTVSSGNVGAAVAAYGASANIPTIVLVHQMSPLNKVLQIQTYGANLFKVQSNSTGDILQAVKKYCDKYHFQNLITASTVNPYINHGAKTIAYEIISEILLNGNLAEPDWVIIPVGGGGLLAAFYQGMQDLVELGIIEKIPRLVGVQPKGCAPLATAVQEKTDIENLFKTPWENINTVATALADDIPLDARLAIPAITHSGGCAVIVNDEEILYAEHLLAKTEGIFAEPSSSATVAALIKLRNQDQIKSTENVYLLVTGTGFKDMDSVKQFNSATKSIPLDHDWNQIFLSMIEEK